jgi:hypothetical protein
MIKTTNEKKNNKNNDNNNDNNNHDDDDENVKRFHKLYIIMIFETLLIINIMFAQIIFLNFEQCMFLTQHSKKIDVHFVHNF